MTMPPLLTVFLAAALAVICIGICGGFAAVGLVLLNLRDMARYTGRHTTAAWRRWRLRAWWNRANRFRYRKHARDLNGLRCPADIPADEGFVDSKTIAALRCRGAA